MKQYKARDAPYQVNIEVLYLPFPNEKVRDNAYDVQAKMYLRVQERLLRECRESKGKNAKWEK